MPTELRTTDHHTAGEPFRIVLEGVPPIHGATVHDRREAAARTEEIDRLRRLPCHEPRGHAAMYGCFLVEPDDDGAAFGGQLHQRNVAIFADGEVVRSLTGSATSARTALLAADGVLADGQSWRNTSIVGTSFDARVLGRVPEGLLTEVVGTAFRTGEHRFVLDPRDPLDTGFVLR